MGIAEVMSLAAVSQDVNLQLREGVWCSGYVPGLGSQTLWLQIPFLQLASGLASGKRLNLSVLFPSVISGEVGRGSLFTTGVH